MPSSRCLFRLVPSEPPTDETGCSSSQGELLPTPIAWDGEKGGARKVKGKTTDTTHKYSTSLKDRAAAGLLPTPVSQGLKVCDKNGKTRFIDLSLLPTPTAGEALKWRNQLDINSQMGTALNALAVNGLLPTPSARDLKGKTNPGVRKAGSGCIYGELLPDAVARIVSEAAAAGCGLKHRGNDGLPFDVDRLTLSFGKWRTEALKAYGNAIVPQVMYEIFRAIDIIEHETA